MTNKLNGTCFYFSISTPRDFHPFRIDRRHPFKAVPHRQYQTLALLRWQL